MSSYEGDEGLNHNLYHIPSETPTESPTTSVSVTVRPSIYQAEVASLWPLATVEGAETFYIYEYELGGVPQS